LLLLLLPLVARKKLCRRRLQLAIWISNKLLPSPLDLFHSNANNLLTTYRISERISHLTVCNALMYNTGLERQIAASKNSLQHHKKFKQDERETLVHTKAL
jgi:hypothetical protein